MVNNKIRLIIFFAAKDGEVLYSQQKQDQELTVAWIMNSLLPNSDLNYRKQGKPLDHSGMTWIKSLMIIQWKWQIQEIRSDRQSAWWTMDIVEGTGIKTIPKKKKWKKAKWLSKEAL